MEIKKGEIVVCNLKLKSKNKITILNDILFSRFYVDKYPILYKKQYKYFFNKHKLKDDFYEVVKIEILLRTGFKHKSKKYIKANKSDVTRDVISGKYD
jgi:hypothetical protein